MVFSIQSLVDVVLTDIFKQVERTRVECVRYRVSHRINEKKSAEMSLGVNEVIYFSDVDSNETHCGTKLNNYHLTN